LPGDGRIDLAELDDRLSQGYAAKTYGQLQVLLADLPVHFASIRQQTFCLNRRHWSSRPRHPI
jgi:hypothetical protein